MDEEHFNTVKGDEKVLKKKKPAEILNSNLSHQHLSSSLSDKILPLKS